MREQVQPICFPTLAKLYGFELYKKRETVCITILFFKHTHKDAWWDRKSQASFGDRDGQI